MKKTVILILMVLPIILIFVISFAGRILANYTHIYVERIAFLNETGDEYRQEQTVLLPKGTQKQLNVKVYPELATNKGFKFIYDKDENSIFDINESGVLTTKEYGTGVLIAETAEKALISKLIIVVVDTEIESITFNVAELELDIGAKYKLVPEIIPHTAVPKNITWSSTDASVVDVDANGNVTAISPGTATITAKTLNGKTAEVEVGVTENLSRGVYFVNEYYPNVLQTTASRINLHDITLINMENKSFSDLNYAIITGGADNAVKLESEDNEVYLNFGTTKLRVVKVRVAIIGTEFYDEINIVYV